MKRGLRSRSGFGADKIGPGRAPAQRASHSFAARIVAWQAAHGRRDLPWHGGHDPYRVWLSEVMLQQTQVATVLPYFERFCRRFPDVVSLAAAPRADVLALWSGLGYYARARNLHACAQQIVERFGGRFPADAQTLATLSGVGRSTAAAIAAFCFGERAAILDGNVKRVLTRYFGIEGYPGTQAVERRLWSLAETLLPESGAMPAYSQGLMDLGALICTRRAPACESCPLQRGCRARREHSVDRLPTAAPRRTPRQRTYWLLLAVHRGEVLLQQRAAAGIWGGLLSPPQFDSLAGLRRAAQVLDPRGKLRPISARRHGLTHFTMTLRPYRLDLHLSPSAVREDDQAWLALDRLDAAALPAPIRTLLGELAAGEASVNRGPLR